MEITVKRPPLGGPADFNWAEQDRRSKDTYDIFGRENNYDSLIGGSASVVSTVRDLFKWDESFEIAAGRCRDLSRSI